MTTIVDVAPTPEERSRRRRVRLALILVVLAVGAAAVWLIHHFDPSTRHGDPDPGGKRFALLTRIADRVVPPGASALHRELRKSHWDPGGCDGGAAGWSRMEVEQVFHAAGQVPAEMDAAMRKQRWRAVPVQGGSAIRQYEPINDPAIDGFAWLFRKSGAGGATWQLILSAGPAEVPTHAC